MVPAIGYHVGMTPPAPTPPPAPPEPAIPRVDLAATWGALARGGPDAPVLAALGGGLFAMAWLRRVRRLPWAALGFRRPPLREFLLAPALAVFLIGLAALGALKAGATVAPPPAGWGGFSLAVAALALEIFVANLLVEEFLFRGCLLGGLRSFGGGRALLASSLLFGLWHFPVGLWRFGLAPDGAALYAAAMALLGSVLGRSYLRSGGSILPPALFHGAWNALAYALFPYAAAAGILGGAGARHAHPEFGPLGIALPLVAWSLVDCPFLALHRRREEARAASAAASRSSAAPAPTGGGEG